MNTTTDTQSLKVTANRDGEKVLVVSFENGAVQEAVAEVLKKLLIDDAGLEEIAGPVLAEKLLIMDDYALRMEKWRLSTINPRNYDDFKVNELMVNAFLFILEKGTGVWSTIAARNPFSSDEDWNNEVVSLNENLTGFTLKTANNRVWRLSQPLEFLNEILGRLELSAEIK